MPRRYAASGDDLCVVQLMNDTDNPTKSDGLSETVAIAEQIRALCSVITKATRSELDSKLKQNGSAITAIEHGVLRHLSDPFRKITGWRARPDVPALDEHTLGSRGADYAQRIRRLLDGGPGSLEKPAKDYLARLRAVASKGQCDAVVELGCDQHMRSGWAPGGIRRRGTRAIVLETWRRVAAPCRPDCLR